MKYFLVGLGNPGEEYEDTRHNTGRIVLGHVMKKFGFDPLVKNGKLNALVAKGEIGGSDVLAIEPETFMNKSGSSVVEAIKSKKDLERLIVIYDDVDLPLGTLKISYNRSSGGHNGLESVIKKLKTPEFTRFRIGIAPTTPSGKIKKPKGEDKVLDFLLGKFKDKELDELKKVSKKVAEAIVVFVESGKDRAMGEFNSG